VPIKWLEKDKKLLPQKNEITGKGPGIRGLQFSRGGEKPRGVADFEKKTTTYCFNQMDLKSQGRIS